MPLLQLTLLAVVALVGLAILRMVRVRLGRSPLPDGRVRFLFLLAFVAAPPIAVGTLIEPAATAGRLPGLSSVPVYAVIVAGLAIVMWIAARVVRLVARGEPRRLMLLALIGSDGGPDEIPSDPPVTARLAESLAHVDMINALFPRGPAFPDQIDRAGFRVDWDALDGATRTLEGRIADDNRLGLGVASAATATATDARSRLDTLRRLAVDNGQAWAAG